MNYHVIGYWEDTKQAYYTDMEYFTDPEEIDTPSAALDAVARHNGYSSDLRLIYVCWTEEGGEFNGMKIQPAGDAMGLMNDDTDDQETVTADYFELFEGK